MVAKLSVGAAERTDFRTEHVNPFGVDYALGWNPNAAASRTRECTAPGELRAAFPRNAENHRVKFSDGLPIDHVAARNVVSKSPIFGLSELLRAGIPPGKGQRDVVHRNYYIKSKLERKGTQIEPSYKHVLVK